MLAAFGVYMYGDTVIADEIRRYIENFGSRVLGCKVKVGAVDFSMKGKLTIRNLQIMNPRVKGVEWSSEDLFTIAYISANVDSQKLWASSSKDIEINDIIVRHCSAHYEQLPSQAGWSLSSALGFGGDSNFSMVFKNIQEVMPARKKPAPQHDPEPNPQNRQRVILRKVDVQDVEMEMVTDLSRSMGSAGQHLRLGDLNVPDFSESTKMENADTIVHFFVNTVVRSVLYQVTGKKQYHFGDVSSALAQYTRDGSIVVIDAVSNTVNNIEEAVVSATTSSDP
jgi:hypothetical protein